MALKSFPTRVRWDSSFRFVEYIVENRIERAAWRLEARPEEQCRLPADSCLCDFWSDAKDRWHVITQHQVEEHPKPGYALLKEFGTRWDQVADGRWQAGGRDSMVDQYGGCLPWKRLTEGTTRPASVVLRDLLDSMRIVRHDMILLRRLPASPNDESYPALMWEPFKVDSAIGLEMRSETGDEDHAMEPVIWVDKKHERRVTVWDRGGTHNDAFGQVAFAQCGEHVLVAAEYSGAYPIVADMRTGRVVLRVSRPSARAVWVPAPK